MEILGTVQILWFWKLMGGAMILPLFLIGWTLSLTVAPHEKLVNFTAVMTQRRDTKRTAKAELKAASQVAE